MADDETKRRLIEQFVNVTGTDEERARFFLEMGNWNVEISLTNFFENNEASDSEVPMEAHVPAPSRNLDHSAQRPTKPPPTSSAAKGPAAKSTNKSSRIASLGSLRNDERSEGSSEEEGQAYYAGGSERTGQQILGPPKKKNDPNQLINNLFAAAREHGAEEVEPADGSSSGPHVVPFQGRAYRLGGPTTDSEVIEGARSPERRRVEFVLKMWKDGFSLNDGPLRDHSEPANREFLQSVMKNQIPRELIEQARGGEVGLSIEDHHHQEYAAPKKVTQSFGGVGHRLGSPTDAVLVSGAAQATPSAGSAAAPPPSTSSEVEAAKSIGLDPAKPVTNLQIRLADGSRLVAKFNQTHQISDVRRYIISVRPQYACANFVLMTTFPNKELSDENQTLAAANLLNAVLVQKLK